VILGCAQPEGESGWNIARMAILRAGLPVEIPGVTVNRLCSSGLEGHCAGRSAHSRRRRTRGGGRRRRDHEPAAVGRAQAQPNPWLAEHYPAALLTMGLTAERVARHYEVSREDQDAFALASHQKAMAAQAAGGSTKNWFRSR
jgi:acetyl-CoA acyltransferase